MKNNTFKQTIEFVGLDYKKEIVKIALINLLLLVGVALIAIFTRNLVYSLIAVSILLGIDYFLFTKYGAMRKALIKGRDEEFITIINYFQTFISNNYNVYQAFNNLIDYSSLWMQDKIKIFLSQIDNDKSVQPFIDFSNNFIMGAIKNVMLSIYQMIEQGENSAQLMDFTFLFHEISKSKNEELKKNKERSLSGMTSYPLIGAAGVTVILTLSIISVLGEMMNVV